MQKIIYSGNYAEIEQYTVSSNMRRKHRGEKENISREAQIQLNNKNSKKKLTRLINTNFTKQDLFLTLTYKEDITELLAKKELAKFIRKVNTYRKKLGLTLLKYISVTETGEKGHRVKRVHHHLVCSGMSIDELEKLWGNGRTQSSRLEPDENGFEGLANYLLKEDKGKHVKKWNQSKNLIKPRVVKKLLKRLNIYNQPKPLKGYKVVNVEVKDNIYFGFYRYIQLSKLE